MNLTESQFEEYVVNVADMSGVAPAVVNHLSWKFGRYTVSIANSSVYLNDVDVVSMDTNDLIALTRTALSRSNHPGIQALMTKVKEVIHQKQLINFTEYDIEEMLSVNEPPKET